MKKYSRKKAWEQFEKGVFMTKREKAEVHESLLESASRISPEDRQRYEENLRHRMDLISHLSGLQNVIFWPLTLVESKMSSSDLSPQQSHYLIRLQNLWIKKKPLTGWKSKKYRLSTKDDCWKISSQSPQSDFWLVWLFD